jgi:hypothetical protein
VRTPVFELHIRPMFREIDREHMEFEVDLWDYDAVVADASEILTRLETDMPPEDVGGPWPDEWVEVFRRWMMTGFRRLELGIGQYAVKRTATSVTLTATGTFPAAGYRGWLDIESQTDTAKTYVLYFEAPDAPVEAAATNFELRDRYKLDSRSVFVHDSAGIHRAG